MKTKINRYALLLGAALLGLAACEYDEKEPSFVVGGQQTIASRDYENHDANKGGTTGGMTESYVTASLFASNNGVFGSPESVQSALSSNTSWRRQFSHMPAGGGAGIRGRGCVMSSGAPNPGTTAKRTLVCP